MKTITLLPVITEKASAQIKQNKYTFLVEGGLNRIELKKFIEKKFSVEVTAVNMLKKMSKTRRRGMISGKTTERKKAIVTLKEGHAIESIKGLL